MIELNENNFLIFAIKNYNNPECGGMEDLEADIKRFKYLKRLFGRYEKKGVLSERLILNHLVVLYNVFGDATTKLLFFQIEEKYWAILKSFLVFIKRLPLDQISKPIKDEFSDIPLDGNVLETLRNL
tara:strand:+ start:782 stop:1162 length:381 start_codon:yes stop_codon:yes gene_type:complete